MKSCLIQWNAVEFNDILWNAMDFMKPCEIQWISWNPADFSWNLVDFRWISDNADFIIDLLQILLWISLWISFVDFMDFI